MSDIATSDTTVIRNAHLPHREGLYQISIEDNQICGIEAELNEPAADQSQQTVTQQTVIDVEGDWVSLGAVDLQINGALGLAFPDLRMKDTEKLQTFVTCYGSKV